MKRVSALLLSMCMLLFANAQEYLGVRNSNYAGVQGLFLNPSSMADSKLKWDINVAAVGTIFDNDFFFIHRKDVPVLGFRKIVNGIVHEDLFDNHFDPRTPNKQYNIIVSGGVIGPSFYTEISKNNWIGFTMATRAYINNNDLPGHMAQNLYTDFKDKALWNKQWNDHTTSFNSLGWMEYGLHYATVLKSNRKHEWKAGVSLNFLQGINGAYAKNTNINYQVPDSGKLILTNSSMDYGLLKYESKKGFVSPRNLNHGSGISGSVGITYVLFRDPSFCGYESNVEKWDNTNVNPYKIKIGVSLIDIGSIKFSKNTRAYHLETDSAVFDIPPQTGNDLNQGVASIALQLDSIKTLTADHFNMALPAALSVQVDWNVYKQFFLNATIIKGFNQNNQAIARPDSYSLTPRYETALFEVSMPMSLIYYHRWQPRIGLAVRIGYFYFGGDAPGSLLGLSDFERTDFYAGVHFFPLQIKARKKNYYKCPDM